MRETTTASTPTQQEYIREQTANYHCKACGGLTIVHKEEGVHKHRLCGDCYNHTQPFLGV